MSINVSQVSAAVTEQSAGANAYSPRVQPSPLPVTVTPDPGARSVPKPEGQAPSSIVSQADSPPYEVQMQHDPQLENELIFKYVDRAGNLILQVPSVQALSIKRAILDEFRQRPGTTREAARRL